MNIVHEIPLLVEPPVKECVGPYELGQLDAHDGLACTPGAYFVRPCDMIQYVEGHQSVAGETVASRQILRLYAGGMAVPMQERQLCNNDVEMAWLALFAQQAEAGASEAADNYVEAMDCEAAYLCQLEVDEMQNSGAAAGYPWAF